MAPSAAPTYTYCTAADIDFLLSADGTTGRVDDDDSSSQSVTEAGYVTRAINWATSTCNLYLSAYQQSDLAQSWLVNQWCTILAAFMLSKRRGNPAASSLQELKDQALEDLKLVRSGSYQLADVAPRDGAWPLWSNVHVTTWHRIRRVRVQKPISESRSGGPDYRQNTDYPSTIIAPYEQY